MFSTSIATWLEPSHLGDVVRRIKRAFAEALAHRPAIFFIDEIDGIGRRTDFTRDYVDYWNALVNCLLELLDGAARTTGVIVVGATNHPAIIDPALLRSGHSCAADCTRTHPVATWPARSSRSLASPWGH